MITVNISTLKNQLSAILKKVKRGEEVLVMDREHPVAKLSAVSREGVPKDDAALIQELEKRGIIRLPKRPFPSRKWLEDHLIRIPGVSGSQAVLAEREEARF